ncbi:hypothetical protein V1512DRAFT_265718 [Lipomyces arxii]|uniref:uncharacterized protein n=1 Tax=Lipomyces arxii TaxID=56418 RepID=UPI0034CE50B7
MAPLTRRSLRREQDDLFNEQVPPLSAKRILRSQSQTAQNETTPARRTRGRKSYDAQTPADLIEIDSASTVKSTTTTTRRSLRASRSLNSNDDGIAVNLSPTKSKSKSAKSPAKLLTKLSKTSDFNGSSMKPRRTSLRLSAKIPDFSPIEDNSKNQEKSKVGSKFETPQLNTTTGVNAEEAVGDSNLNEQSESIIVDTEVQPELESSIIEVATADQINGSVSDFHDKQDMAAIDIQPNSELSRQEGGQVDSESVPDVVSSTVLVLNVASTPKITNCAVPAESDEDIANEEVGDMKNSETMQDTTGTYVTAAETIDMISVIDEPSLCEPQIDAADHSFDIAEDGINEDGASTEYDIQQTHPHIVQNDEPFIVKTMADPLLVDQSQILTIQNGPISCPSITPNRSMNFEEVQFGECTPLQDRDVLFNEDTDEIVLDPRLLCSPPVGQSEPENLPVECDGLSEPRVILRPSSRTLLEYSHRIGKYDQLRNQFRVGHIPRAPSALAFYRRAYSDTSSEAGSDPEQSEVTGFTHSPSQVVSSPVATRYSLARSESDSDDQFMDTLESLDTLLETSPKNTVAVCSSKQENIPSTVQAATPSRHQAGAEQSPSPRKRMQSESPLKMSTPSSSIASPRQNLSVVITRDSPSLYNEDTADISDFLPESVIEWEKEMRRREEYWVASGRSTPVRGSPDKLGPKTPRSANKNSPTRNSETSPPVTVANLSVNTPILARYSRSPLKTLSPSTTISQTFTSSSPAKTISSVRDPEEDRILMPPPKTPPRVKSPEKNKSPSKLSSPKRLLAFVKSLSPIKSSPSKAMSLMDLEQQHDFCDVEAVLGELVHTCEEDASKQEEEAIVEKLEDQSGNSDDTEDSVTINDEEIEKVIRSEDDSEHNISEEHLENLGEQDSSADANTAMQDVNVGPSSGIHDETIPTNEDYVEVSEVEVAIKENSMVMDAKPVAAIEQNSQQDKYFDAVNNEVESGESIEVDPQAEADSTDGTVTGSISQASEDASISEIDYTTVLPWNISLDRWAQLNKRPEKVAVVIAETEDKSLAATEEPVPSPAKKFQKRSYVSTPVKTTRSTRSLKRKAGDITTSIPIHSSRAAEVEPIRFTRSRASGLQVKNDSQQPPPLAKITETNSRLNSGFENNVVPQYQYQRGKRPESPPPDKRKRRQPTKPESPLRRERKIKFSEQVGDYIRPGHLKGGRAVKKGHEAPPLKAIIKVRMESIKVSIKC